MRKIVIILLTCVALQAFSNKITNAYKALSGYDYFKAKNLFYKSLSKYPNEASFGLATIYFRNDNPFSNVDSAAKYIALSNIKFKDSISYDTFHITKNNIENLSNDIAKKGFIKYAINNNQDSVNHFLNYFYFANKSILDSAFNIRDEIALNYYLSFKSSDSARYFSIKYPQSKFVNLALAAGNDFEYQEKVNIEDAQQLKYFLKNYKKNTNVKTAELTLFEIIKQLHNADSLYTFINTYSSALTKEEAWKLLYSISVKDYNKEVLTTFLNKYPNYPFNENVAKEISLSQVVLFPIKFTTDKFGYIDTLGNWIITPQFDDAMPFSEGFAAVCKNDSCFYIDKEGNKTSTYFFEETENYINGIAIVKKNDLYFLINRSGQTISKGFEDINDPSENIYVCKLNNLYGAIDNKANIVIPFLYNKLGDFKNGYAYYLSSNYGLIDINNKAQNADWEWISDVDESNIAIVKKENKFGLLSASDGIILNTEYDYITPAKNEIYILVKNNMYGFYNVKQKCFITNLEFDYNSAYTKEYYTNGKNFKLIKKDAAALIDANGHFTINYNTYTDLYFSKYDIIRIKQNKKFGYVDRKLKPITSVEYDEAFDFKNNIAIVIKKGTCQLINTQNKILYSIKDGLILDNFADNYYQIALNEKQGLINNKGEVLLNTEYESIKLINANLFHCKKNEEVFLFNTRSKLLKKI